MGQRLKWKLDIGEDALMLVSDDGTKQIQLPYPELCRIQKIGLWQNLRALFMHLKERPEAERMEQGEPVRGIVPLGFDKKNVLRRLRMFSPDLLLQLRSGKTVLISLNILSSQDQQELWTVLALKRPDLVLQHDRQILQTAVEKEKAAGELYWARQWAQARECFRDARGLWEKIGYMDCVERCLRHEVECLLSLGEYGEASGLSARALELAQNMHNLDMGLDQRRNMADNLAALGRIQWSIGGTNGLKMALKHLEEAEGYYRELGLPFFECRMKSNQALIYEQMYILTNDENYLKECRRIAEEALKILQIQLQGDRSAIVRLQEANLWGTLARCYFHKGDYAKAESQFEAARSIAHSAIKGDIPDDVAMYGYVLFRKSQEDGLDQSEAERLRCLDKAINELNRAVEMAQGSGSLQTCLEVYSLRGDTFWEMGNLEAAVRDYEVVVTLMERDRFAFARPFDRVGHLRRYHRVYRRLVETLLHLAEREPKQACQWIESAFQYNERIKARTLAELLSISTMLLSTISDDVLRRSFEEAKRNLQEAYLQMETLQKCRQDIAPSALLTAFQRLQQAQESYEQAYQRVIEVVPALDELVSPRTPSLSKVRDWLPRDGSGAVLEFCIGEESLCVFLITKQGDLTQTCFTIPRMGLKAIEDHFVKNGFLKEYEAYAEKQQEIIDLQKPYFDAWCEWQQTNDPLVSTANPPSQLIELQEHLALLTDELIEMLPKWVNCLPDLIQQIDSEILSASGSNGVSIRQLLEELKIKRLVIVPDGVLQRLPIHAALDEVIEVTYAPSSAVLIQTILRSSRVSELRRRALVVANPAHQIGDLTIDLPESEYEANLVCAKLRKNDFSVEELRGKNADSSTIIARMRDSLLCHLSTHAMSDYHSPLGSHIKVAHTGEKSKPNWESGFLTVRRLMLEGAVCPGAKIIVPACEAGLVRHDPGGEYVGLPAAFLIAGASLVIAPLWTVHAGTPIIIMDYFYTNVLEKGWSEAAALKGACAKLRSMTLDDIKTFENDLRLPVGTVLFEEDPFNNPAHPWHWAGYIVWGAAWSEQEVSEEAAAVEKESKELLELPFHLGVGVSPEVTEIIKQVNRLFDQGQYKEALPLLESAIQKWGWLAYLHDGLSAAYAAQDKFKKALHHSLEALRCDPNNARYYYNLGCLYRDHADISNARACFQKALTLNPAHANSLFNLAQLAATPDEALQLLEKARLIDPNDPDISQAIAVWERMVGEDRGTIAQHHLLWSVKALEKNDLRSARIHLALAREAPLSDKDKALAFKIESDILRNANDIRASIRALERAIGLDPSQPAYWNTLSARKIILAGEPTISADERELLYMGAKEDARKAISLGDYAKPHQNLAHACLATGALGEAREEAATARDMAQRQIQQGPSGELRCKGCPTMGQNLSECQECLRKAEQILRDIDLASGNYKVR